MNAKSIKGGLLLAKVSRAKAAAALAALIVVLAIYIAALVPIQAWADEGYQGTISKGYDALEYYSEHGLFVGATGSLNGDLPSDDGAGVNIEDLWPDFSDEYGSNCWWAETASDRNARLNYSAVSSDSSVLKVEYDYDDDSLDFEALAAGEVDVTISYTFKGSYGSYFASGIWHFVVSESPNYLASVELDPYVGAQEIADCPVEGCEEAHFVSYAPLSYSLTGEDASLPVSYASYGVYVGTDVQTAIEQMTYMGCFQLGSANEGTIDLNDISSAFPEGITKIVLSFKDDCSFFGEDFCWKNDYDIQVEIPVKAVDASAPAFTLNDDYEKNSTTVLYAKSGSESLMGFTSDDYEGSARNVFSVEEYSTAMMLGSHAIKSVVSSDESVVVATDEKITPVGAGSATVTVNDWWGGSWTAYVSVADYSSVNVDNLKFESNEIYTSYVGDWAGVSDFVTQSTLEEAGYSLYVFPMAGEESLFAQYGDKLSCFGVGLTEIRSLKKGSGTLGLYFWNPATEQYTLCDTKAFEVEESPWPRMGVVVGPASAFASGAITPGYFKLKIGESAQLGYRVYVEGYDEDAYDSIGWSSNDEVVVSVSDDGVMTANSEGVTSVHCSLIKTYSSEYSSRVKGGYVMVRVLSDAGAETVKPTSVSISGAPTDAVELGSDAASGIKLTATVSPEDATDKTVAWSSSDESVATIDSEGSVTVKGAGSVTFTATCNGNASVAGTASMTVVAGEVPATSVTISEADAAMAIGETQTLTATVEPADSTDSVVWSSSDASVLAVDANGKVTAVGNGAATITATAGSVSASTGAITVTTPTPVAETQAMYRLYNPNSGEHFYTASAEERDNLDNIGWNYEGIGWTAPKTSETPVYRLYNPNSGDHHYSTSAAERDYLDSIGWNYEGIGWYSDDAKGQALYRLFNPNALTATHHYTASAVERDWLVSLGWRAEGTAWYGVKQ